jgi:hypothetical protein
MVLDQFADEGRRSHEQAVSRPYEVRINSSRRGAFADLRDALVGTDREAGAPDRVSRGDGSSHRSARDRGRSLNRVSDTLRRLSVALIHSTKLGRRRSVLKSGFR